MKPSHIILIIIAVAVVGGFVFWKVFYWKTYQNETYEFSFRYPPNMTFQEYSSPKLLGVPVSSASIVLSKKKSQATILNINVSIQKTVVVSITDVNSPEELQQFHMQECRINFPAAPPIFLPAEAVCNAFPLASPFLTKEGVFGGVSGGPTSVRIEFVKNGLKYIITGPKESGEKTILAIAKTFHFTNP